MLSSSIAAAFAFVASVSAITITSPTTTKGWSNVGSNTDPLNFTMILDGNTYNQVLAALVTTSDKTATVNAPSSNGGWPAPGNDYRINFVQDQDHTSTIYAQSSQFNITAPATPSGSSTSQSTASTPVTPPSTPSGAAAGSSDTGGSNASGNRQCGALAMGVQTGFVAGAVLLTAVFAL
ncbi:hypothetical protein C8R46DRAFT_1071967 [Mycena filopes]|nr:hypothetical protein C8R46DRAFT_1071967 [Mycena filopes]